MAIGRHPILKHCGAIHKRCASAGSRSLTYTGTVLRDAFIVHLSGRVFGFTKPPHEVERSGTSDIRASISQSTKNCAQSAY
jgi:hypothetical protein